MNKKTILPILIIIFFPSITFAAWYNPISWFKTAPKAPEKVEISTIKPEIKPVVTNTITVENPKLQSQINDLVQKNNTFQNQILEISNKYNVLAQENALLVAENKALKDEIATLKAPKKQELSLKFIKVSEPTSYALGKENYIKVYGYDNDGKTICSGVQTLTSEDGITTYRSINGIEDNGDCYYRMTFTPTMLNTSYTVKFSNIDMSKTINVANRLSGKPL